MKWCPTNPNVFVAITSSGDILFYDLSKSTTEHISKISFTKLMNDLNHTSLINNSNTSSLSTTVNTSAPPNTNTTAALNKLLWSNDGKILFIGDAKGCVHSFEVQESITTRFPGDDSKFESALNILTQSQNINNSIEMI